MALHLRLAKNAIPLNGLSEPGQQVFLRLAIPELNKHKDTLSLYRLALRGRWSLLKDWRATSGPYQRLCVGECLAKHSRQYTGRSPLG